MTHDEGAVANTNTNTNTDNNQVEKFGMTHDEGAVAHVDDVSEETTVDVLDDRTHADLVMIVRTRIKMMIMITM